MKREIVISLVCLMIVSGCDGPGTYVDDYVCGQNRANLINLQLGMSKDQVKTVMGKPDRSEAAGKRELWFYRTSSRRMLYGGYESVSTPLSFKEGLLEGWGQNFVVGEDVDKYEVRIR